MKRFLIIAFCATCLIASIAIYKSDRRYREHQTCVELNVNPVADVVTLALSSNHDEVLAAADAFAGYPTNEYLPAGVFSDPLPSDSCFAERLYTKAARMGNSTALTRLEGLYSCQTPMAFGTASAAGLTTVDGVRSGQITASEMNSDISRISYLPDPFRCAASSRNTICQTPPRSHPAWQTKQAILCSDSWDG